MMCLYWQLICNKTFILGTNHISYHNSPNVWWLWCGLNLEF